MIVATRTGNRKTQKCRASRRDKVIHFIGTRPGVVLDNVFRPSRQVARSNKRSWVAGSQLIPGKLMLKKCVVRHVLIEGIDDPVTIPPGIRPVFISFKAAGVRVADDVQPVPSPALAVLRAGEKAIDNLWPGIWSAVLFECLHFFKCRGQAG